MSRLKYNGLRAAVGAGGLASGATTLPLDAALTHSNGVSVPTISGGDYLPLVILDSTGHISEVVWVTAYTLGATTATITRGKEGTSAAAHSAGDAVIGSVLADDIYMPGGGGAGYLPVKQSAKEDDVAWQDMSSRMQFRGVWAADSLAYSQSFPTPGTPPAPFTTNVINSVPGYPTPPTVTSPGPSGYANYCKIGPNGNGYNNPPNKVELVLNMADLGITGITRIKYWFMNTGDQYSTSYVSKNGTDVEAYGGGGSGNPQSFAQKERVASSTDVWRWGMRGAYAIGVGSTGYAGVAGIEVYAVSQPYMNGDIVVYGGRLYKSAIDSNGSTPGADANWTPIPLYAGAKLTKSANQNFTAPSTFNAVVWDQEDHDTDGLHDNATNNTRITIPASWNGAKVELETSVRMSLVSGAGGDGADRVVEIRRTRSGSTVAVGRGDGWSTGDHSQYASTGTLTVQTGDYFEVYAYEDAPGVWAIASLISYFQIKLVG